MQTQEISIHLKDASLLRSRAFIAGVWTVADDGAEFDVRNPATGQLRGAPLKLPSAHGSHGAHNQRGSVPAFCAAGST
jgi:succinate-semialdehyde dehydrogenase/glutarate-semialdehyde dehydrogenase